MQRRSFTMFVLVWLGLVFSAGHTASLAATRNQNHLQATSARKVLLPMVHGPSIFSAQPNPLHLQPSVDSSRAISATIPTTGGTLTTTASDGTRFTLTLPQDALLIDTTITLTPISRVSGLPASVRFVAGVDVQPDGQRLYQPATLVMELPTAKAIPIEREVSFASHDAGTQAHLYPLQVQPRNPTFNLFHFSKYYVGDGITLDMTEYKPTLTEDQIQHYMHETLRGQREAHQRGEAGDPQFAAKLEYLLREYFYLVVDPLLRSAQQDCATAQRALPRAFSWLRQVELLGLDPRFSAEDTQVKSAWVKILDRCWNEVTKPCLDKNNRAQMDLAIRITRQAQLIGMEGYDPFGVPGCNCSNVTQVTQGWELTVNFAYSDAAQGTLLASNALHKATSAHSANVTARLDQREPGSNTWSGTLTGDVQIEETTHVSYRDYESWSRESGSGSPRTVDRAGAPVQVHFSPNPDTCTYFLWVPIRVASQYTDSEGTSLTNDAIVANLHLLTLPVRWTEETTNFTIRDTQTLTINQERELARIYFSGDGYTMITQLKGMHGEVAVRWNITSIGMPSGQ